MEYTWIAFPAGILIATVASAIGIGGGVLWMPFLLVVLNIRPDTAVLTSLMIQTAGMGSSSTAFFMQKRIDFRLALLFLMVALPGIFSGAYLLKHIKPSHMEMILGILVMTTAFLFVSSNQKYEDIGKNRAEIKTAFRYSWVTVFASIITGMLSISMSEWLIPLMRTRLSLKMSSAIATCIFIAFGTCIISSSMHIVLGGKASLTAVCWGVPGVIIGGQIGPRIIKRINERILKEVFIFLLTLVGIHLIYNAF
ncbi:Putative sulfite/organosulfonate ABC transporter, permease protein [Desulfonema limicola]|uniref:Probable membrane transporter protein n=1 Tax=Desulfonema limicola TaxID=45656 RepID=A0A975B3V1_9BACT|nr:sulfite exporter TauE/SafE family protein [Desulfonema limicola]QTA78307.1 Putative sulfite/organosulfonate ABC transporter, permease protein [Desulfonema limicola]